MGKNSNIPGKLGAVSEVFFIILAANILIGFIAGPLIPPELRGIAFDPAINNAWPAALSSALNIAPKLGILLLMSLLAWKLLHRRSLKNMKLTRNSYPLARLMGIGVLTFAFANLPWKATVMVNLFFPFGEGLHAWDAINAGQFSGGLVALIAATAMLLPPLLEEPTVRGYQLSRLGLNFAPVSAILITGIMFPLLHGHFYQSDPVVIMLLASFIFSSILYSYVAWRSGSVIPLIVAHSLSNSPEPSNKYAMAAIVLAMLAVAFRYRKTIAQELRAFRKLWQDCGRERLDFLWVFPVLALILSPALIERSYLLASMAVLLILAIAGRQRGKT